jgi:hypothetical protein
MEPMDPKEQANDMEPLIDNDDKERPREADEEKEKPVSEEEPPSESSFGTDSD